MTHKVLQTERMVFRRMDMSDVDDLMSTFSDRVAMRATIPRYQEPRRGRGLGALDSRQL